MSKKLSQLALGAVGSLLCMAYAAQAPTGSVVYIPLSDAKPMLDSMAEAVPTELQQVSPGELPRVWQGWVKKRDHEIRARLEQGDADSIVNLLLFGTSFTREPRMTSKELSSWESATQTGNASEGQIRVQEVVKNRIRDLVTGMASGTNERLAFSRHVLGRSGIRLGSPEGAQQAEAFLIQNLTRVLQEQKRYQQDVASAISLNDPTEEFAERSTLYRNRGLSLDTSLPPDFALEKALTELGERGLLKPGSVKRVGIIGPGLDFTDKQEGYDFYPTQTVQPFAVMDSLLRLGLAEETELEVDTLDLSQRINEHVKKARELALAGRGYTIQLPRDPGRGWNRDVVKYWERFGDQIGKSVAPVAVPDGLKGINLRAVQVDPRFVKRIRPIDLNVVLQREDSSAARKFDLLIATNILVYYDTFEQELALANVQAMLRPGGFLLTNNLLLELPFSKMKSVDEVTVAYSARAADGDHIVWYERMP